MLGQIRSGTAPRAFDLHIAPPPLIDGATRPRPILSWGGYALPAKGGRSREAVYEFLVAEMADLASRLGHKQTLTTCACSNGGR